MEGSDNKLEYLRTHLFNCGFEGSNFIIRWGLIIMRGKEKDFRWKQFNLTLEDEFKTIGHQFRFSCKYITLFIRLKHPSCQFVLSRQKKPLFCLAVCICLDGPKTFETTSTLLAFLFTH